jgi:hypothetical protein
MAVDRPLQEILDELAGIALLAEPDDEAALAALKEGVAACREAPDAAALSMPLASLAAQVAAAQGLGDAGGADALAAVRRALAALQEQLAGGGAPAPAAGNAFVLPEWVEEAVFASSSPGTSWCSRSRRPRSWRWRRVAAGRWRACAGAGTA